MPSVLPKSLPELEAHKKAVKDQLTAKLNAARKAHAQEMAAVKLQERKIRALDLREQKKRDNHAKIVLGVALIHQYQASETFAAGFQNHLAAFYADAPLRMEAARHGLTLTVKKPASDKEQDL